MDSKFRRGQKVGKSDLWEDGGGANQFGVARFRVLRR